MPLKTDTREITGLTVTQALAAALESDLVAHAEQTASFMDWAMKVPEPRGPLNFNRWPFQRELYEEGYTDQEMIVMKATQLGISAWLVRWALSWADTRGARVLYVFPRERQLLDFCLARGEQVLMADGTLKPIERIEVGDRVWSSDGVRPLPDTVTQTWVRGRRKVRLVRLAGGRRLRATANHRVYTNRGWLTVGELAEGDEVCVPARTPTPERTSDLAPEDAFLLAVWLAEGYKGAPGYACCCGNSAIRQRLAEIAPRRGWIFREDPRLTMRLIRTRRDQTTPGRLLERYGVRGMTTATVRVPDAVMSASEEAAREFLLTYVACDGYVGPREVTICSISERMVRDLQVLCARLGLAATVRSVQPGYPGSQRAWTLALAGRAREALLGVVPGKPGHRPPVARRVPVDAARPNIVPVRARRLIEAGATQAQAAARLGVTQATVSRNLKRTWCVPEGELLWSKVLSVEPDGEAETFDLTTEYHHAFFTEGALTHNSDARIKPLIVGEYLRTRVPAASVMNKALKAVGLGIIYFRGSEAEPGLESIDADCLALDEHDLLVQKHIPIAERRIGASDLGLIRRIGFPTIANQGIHKEFQRTDQRQWFVKCEFCNLRQAVKWEENVDLERGIRVCSKCRKGPLDLSDGEWVAKHPDRDVRGYHVTKLLVPRQEIMPRLILASQQRVEYKRQVFWNRDLGEPWEGVGNRLTPTMIAAAQREGLVQEEGYYGNNLVFMGVDVASVRALNVWITERFEDGTGKTLFVGLVDSFDDLAKLMDRFRVNMAGIDHLPEGRLARAFADRFVGRAMVINYSETQKNVIDVDLEQRRVSVRRTEAIDTAGERIRGQQEFLPMDLPDGFVEEMTANVRSVEQDDVGRVRVVYRTEDPDDYMQAFTYAIVASSAWWIQQEVQHREEITSGEEIMDMGFDRSTLGDPDAEDEYSAGVSDGDYAMDPMSWQ